VRLSFGNFQNGFIAFVQQTLGHLGYPYALRRRQPSMNLDDAIGSNVFRRVTLKNQAGHLLPGPVRQNKFCSDGIAIRSLFDFRDAAEIL
jgi:hypothetical protein